ncbi:MAG: hypothetical protein JO086_17095 [Acidimicrobiia bacterium]|nr:hypothetical protein [Acidimicrobiia bacterium]
MLPWLTLGLCTVSVVGGTSLQLRRVETVASLRTEVSVTGDNLALGVHLVFGAAGIFAWLFYMAIDVSVLAWSCSGLLAMACASSIWLIRRTDTASVVRARPLWTFYGMVAVPAIVLSAAVAATS